MTEVRVIVFYLDEDGTQRTYVLFFSLPGAAGEYIKGVFGAGYMTLHRGVDLEFLPVHRILSIKAYMGIVEGA